MFALELRCRFFAAALYLTVCALFTGTIASADNWATRLGFPEDARVIILHAHNLGLCHETNQASCELLEAGLVSSVSAMAPCPWFADVAAWSHGRDEIDFGLQLTLNSHLPIYRWKPLGGDAYTRSLVDGDGYQWKNVLQVMINANVEEVERELRMQLLRAERLGVKPTHLTTHLGALYSRQDLTEIYLKISREQWIPAVVIELTPELIERFRRDGYPVPDSLVHILEDYPFPKLKDLRVVPTASSFEEKVKLTVGLLETLPTGLTQVAIRPATDSPALRALDPNWQQRVWEAQLWKHEKVQEELGKPDVIVTSWKEIMLRFEGLTE